MNHLGVSAIRRVQNIREAQVLVIPSREMPADAPGTASGGQIVREDRDADESQVDPNVDDGEA